MDVSKKYIEMCREAKEVQACCPFHEGDFIFNSSANNGTGFIFVNYKHQPLSNKSDWELIYEKDQKRDFNVWLPRQDQLQWLFEYRKEELKEFEGLNSYDSYLTDFSLWITTHSCLKGEFSTYKYKNQFKTMEQLWLAYTMYGYNKIWSEEKQTWVKTKKG